ncbi:MAG: HPF/RaiA family ribosome-associated protein [Sphaerochaeta sp.]|jgi:putative sigma-54 modulation protein|uniref:HPF/RaiA family ribosome-associated protein n=1 Tax=Sphaerochaeta associata TaxID=1129264 RepID=A0ABY4DCQ1_9SPIR|nr:MULTISPECIES: HPF/RaiA family ribosome-associated protein [Sphaerochaeta]MDT3360217.1 HPF/RaiA family ribosome-associated protein [Spirochaetota bacterium]MCK9600171.1 HPF/RaiA family ribosome-associated protein [Sphaerochaeta sp.]MDD2394773.1 HPF/RaiA family ribosome-associated protein [Sphaerochaeta sp.]MDD4037160.1 HPF/RaiA family ribosome-associated protein [Sphaerochaeta sp.]MDX9823803.1 HPF/RaiA family ribosome-associated protein [Sphaerochaeta sp.]
MTIVKGGLMNLTVRGIRYNPSDETREFLDKKLQKLQFAEGYLHDLDIVMTRETEGQGFHLDAKLHFSWGTIKMVSYDCYELYEGIELLTDKIEATARKEKSKIKEH